MNLQQRLDSMKTWTAARLNARCPVKPATAPAMFNWARTWTTVIPGYKGLTVGQFVAQDAYGDTLGATAAARTRSAKLRKAGSAGAVAEYIERWDALRGLKPGAMVILYPTAQALEVQPIAAADHAARRIATDASGWTAVQQAA